MTQKPKIEDVYNYYRSEKEKHTGGLQKLKRIIYHIGTLRLLLIIGMVLALWICRDKNSAVLVAVAGVFSGCFLLFVVYHTKLHDRRSFEEGIIRLFENELKALDDDYSSFDGAAEQVDSQHAFSMDIDLFGERSLFQSINRTVTKMGKETLIDWFKQPLDDKREILSRQDSIREMKDLSDFRHHFFVIGEMASHEKKDIRFSFSTKKLTDNHLFNGMIWIVPTVWALLIAGCILHWIPTSALFIYLGICLLLATAPAKSIQNIYTSVNKTEKILKTYSNLMMQIEQTNFNSVVLKTCQYKLKSDHRNDSASLAISRLSRLIGSLDQRGSFIGIVLNILYMRDLRQAMKLEKWQEEHAEKLPKWFETLGVFDAFCSFGTFAFNHPNYIYPTLADSYFEMEGKALGHPLIPRNQCICNDIHIPESKYFLIVTGANMAGKSTYLRTIAVNFLFSCIGLPVCATSLTVYPAHLVTSLRTADSLVSNESYFFAELKRLKMIIDRLNAGEQLLIILDEILKGTNSVDKQKGSLALIKQLIHKNTCGIIATHDLILGTLSDTFPEHVRNKRFEADIKDDELTFTYQIRDGIAQNMNATFLMKKLGIF